VTLADLQRILIQLNYFLDEEQVMQAITALTLTYTRLFFKR